jgi:hypothetical protein
MTLKGTILPTNPQVILDAHPDIVPPRPVKITVSAPSKAPVPYELSFCIGPRTNPCGMPPPQSYVLLVPGGEERTAVVDSGIFKDKVLAVGQGTAVAIEYIVTIE